MVLHTLGKDNLHSFILEPHCLGYQFFRVKNRLKMERMEKRRFWNNHARKWLSLPICLMN